MSTSATFSVMTIAAGDGALPRRTGVALCRDDLEAQMTPVRTHAVIAAEEAQIRQRPTQQQGAGEVKRIHRQDRFWTVRARQFCNISPKNY